MLERSPHKSVRVANAPRATIDFETRSACDIKRGAWLYSRHHTTQVLCLAYMLPGWDKPKLWHRAHPEIGIKESPAPVELFDWIATGGLIEAHNAEFEIDIWDNICVPDHGWPAVNPEQWCCSAAKAASYSLPRSLDGATKALGLDEKKDEKGKALLRKYSRPRRLTTAERELFGNDILVFNEDVEGLQDLWSYCVQDVVAEHRLSSVLADLTPAEGRLWHITRAMNRRGVLIDRELCEAALDLLRQAKAKLNAELQSLTGIEAGTRRTALKKWLAENESLDLPDTASKTIEFYLTRRADEVSARAARVLQIMKDVNRTSTRKYHVLLQSIDSDDRAREALLFLGAERTGRYAGRGAQFHNLPKGRFTLPLSKAEKKRAIDLACADIKTRNLAWCEMMHGDVMNLIVACLRGTIIAPEGRTLWTADYSAIEARCVLWESGATAALGVFERGEDIYCDMASGIYGYQIVKDEKALAKNPGAVIAKPINAMGATQRDFGKVAVLGLGYGMGFLKFLITLRTYNIILTRDEVVSMMGAEKFGRYYEKVRRSLFPNRDDFASDVDGEKRFKNASREASLNRRKLADAQEDAKAVLHELALCKYTVDTYRARYEEVPAMWKAQEAAAIEAVRHKGRRVECGPVVWYFKGRFLRCRLPSGRELRYCDPEIAAVKTSWGETRQGLRFWGIDRNKKWSRQSTYGGKIVENITQATARDVLAAAKLTLDSYGVYELLLSIHDEIISEADDGDGDKDEFESLMSKMPAYMTGCPIVAEAASYGRYRK